jgi:hypothetical protein
VRKCDKYDVDLSKSGVYVPPRVAQLAAAAAAVVADAVAAPAEK